MIQELIAAAMLARRASTIHSKRRIVEILMTELGLAVRGTYQDARHAFGKSQEVGWGELGRDPWLAKNAVALVIRGLEEKGEELGIAPVREGE